MSTFEVFRAACFQQCAAHAGQIKTASPFDKLRVPSLSRERFWTQPGYCNELRGPAGAGHGTWQRWQEQGALISIRFDHVCDDSEAAPAHGFFVLVIVLLLVLDRCDYEQEHEHDRPLGCSPRAAVVESRSGAVTAKPLRFHSPLIKPNRRISRIRLSDQGRFMLSPTGGWRSFS